MAAWTWKMGDALVAEGPRRPAKAADLLTVSVTPFRCVEYLVGVCQVPNSQEVADAEETPDMKWPENLLEAAGLTTGLSASCARFVTNCYRNLLPGPSRNS